MLWKLGWFLGPRRSIVAVRLSTPSQTSARALGQRWQARPRRRFAEIEEWGLPDGVLLRPSPDEHPVPEKRCDAARYPTAARHDYSWVSDLPGRTLTPTIARRGCRIAFSPCTIAIGYMSHPRLPFEIDRLAVVRPEVVTRTGTFGGERQSRHGSYPRRTRCEAFHRFSVRPGRSARGMQGSRSLPRKAAE